MRTGLGPTCHQAAQEIAYDDAPDSARRLTDCNEATKAQGGGHCVWDLSTGEQHGSFGECLGRARVVENKTHKLRGVTRRPWRGTAASPAQVGQQTLA